MADQRYISNNPSFRQKHPGVPVGSVGSDGSLYPLTVKSRCRYAKVPPSLCVRIRTIRTTRVLTASQRLQLRCSRLHNTWRCIFIFLCECHIESLPYCVILDAALAPYMFSFERFSLITIQSSVQIHCLLLHLLRHSRIKHV